MKKILNPSGTYFVYLRKSRADREAEAHGEGETLLRHKQMLEELADKLGITISKFYQEIVSGETIQDRPILQMLLQDISNGDCDGVLVMEIERLARGDTSDQGTIAKYFKLSDTLIITPLKIYDPCDEYDEEYFEFGLFMSRREYKTINRRIQQGRIASIREGKWIASTAPYGYQRIKIINDKGYTLQIIPEQAEIIRLIFQLYLYGEQQTDGAFKRLGRQAICKKLDDMGIMPATSNKWSPSTIKDILQNPVYIGKVCWGKSIEKKVMIQGKIKKVRMKNSNFQMYHGLHTPIIEEDIFYKVQRLAENNHASPVANNKTLKNPLSGIIRCAQCGSLLARAANNKNNDCVLRCPSYNCNNISAPLALIEKKLLEALEQWLEGYILSFPKEENNFPELQTMQHALQHCQKKLRLLYKQKERAYDLLEQGVYTSNIFENRLQTISEKIKTAKTTILTLERSLEEKQQNASICNNILPITANILELYQNIDSISLKNEILKSILEHVEYQKRVRNLKSKGNYANFTLTIYPKLPKYKSET